MATIGNLICLTPRDSYVVDEPIRKKGLLGRLEQERQLGDPARCRPGPDIEGDLMLEKGKQLLRRDAERRLELLET